MNFVEPEEVRMRVGKNVPIWFALSIKLFSKLGYFEPIKTLCVQYYYAWNSNSEGQQSMKVFYEKRLSNIWTLSIRLLSRSILTVEGSGATCTRIFFELFFQNRWSFYGPVDPKNAKKFKKVIKTPKMHWHHTTQMVMETLVTSG